MKCLRCEKEMEKVTLSQGIVLYEGKKGDKQQEHVLAKDPHIFARIAAMLNSV